MCWSVYSPSEACFITLSLPRQLYSEMTIRWHWCQGSVDRASKQQRSADWYFLAFFNCLRDTGKTSENPSQLLLALPSNIISHWWKSRRGTVLLCWWGYIPYPRLAVLKCYSTGRCRKGTTGHYKSLMLKEGHISLQLINVSPRNWKKIIL